MKMTRQQWIPLVGLVGTIAVALYAVVQLQGQAQAPTADLTKATTVQVKDAQGRIVLQGEFLAPVDEDGGLERWLGKNSLWREHPGAAVFGPPHGHGCPRRTATSPHAVAARDLTPEPPTCSSSPPREPPSSLS